MLEMLRSSFIYKWLTAAAAWLDRQWEKSVLSAVLCGGKLDDRGEESRIGRIGAFAHRLLCAVFKALRLEKVLSGSIFTRTFLWCAAAVLIAPVAPTMAVLFVVMIAFVSLFVSFGLDEKRRLVWSPVNKWIWLYAFVYLFCTFTSVTFFESFKGGILSCAFILFSIVLQNSVKEKKQVDTLIYLMVAAGAAVALYGFVQVIMGVESTAAWVDETIFSDLKLRVYSTLDNPNVLAEYLLLVIPLGAASAVTAKTVTGKGAAAAATGAMLVCMVLTYSRGGWLGLIFSAAIFLVLVDRRFIVIGAAGCVALIFVLPDTVMARFASIGNMSDSSTSYRFLIWMGTLKMLKDYWFCGVGTGVSAFAKIYEKYQYDAVSSPHAHNLYLQVTSECGIAGLVILIGVVCSFIRSTASALKNCADKNTAIQLKAVISGMGGFLLQSMTDHSFYNYRVMLMFWIVVALGVLLSRHQKKENCQ